MYLRDTACNNIAMNLETRIGLFAVCQLRYALFPI